MNIMGRFIERIQEIEESCMYDMNLHGVSMENNLFIKLAIQ